MNEAQMHERNCFLTLTYNDDHLPQNRSLDKRAWQLFSKRLRERLAQPRGAKRREPPTFKYYAVGEYGDDDQRPHFHAAIFGQDFSADRHSVWKTKHGFLRWESDELAACWQEDGESIGFHEVQDLTFESAAYIARYVTKKITGPPALEHYRRVDESTGEVFNVEPEFSLISKGIGLSWFKKYRGEVYPSDNVVSGKALAKPPRYYDRWLEKLDPDLYEQVKSNRKENKREFTPEQLENQEEHKYQAIAYSASRSVSDATNRHERTKRTHPSRRAYKLRQQRRGND